jgi:hypothetical protein
LLMWTGTPSERVIGRGEQTQAEESALSRSTAAAPSLSKRKILGRDSRPHQSFSAYRVCSGTGRSSTCSAARDRNSVQPSCRGAVVSACEHRSKRLERTSINTLRFRYTYLVEVLQRIDPHPACDVHLLILRLWNLRGERPYERLRADIWICRCNGGDCL